MAQKPNRHRRKPAKENGTDDGLISRRCWLGATIGAAALAVGGTAWFVTGNKSPSDSKSPKTSDLLSPLGEWNKEAIAGLYSEITQSVDEVFEEARKRGKTPLFVLGELHNSAKGALIGAMIVDAVGQKTRALRKQGEVFYEVDQSLMDKMLNEQASNVLRNDNSNLIEQITKVHTGKKHGMKQSPMDDPKIRARVDHFFRTGQTDNAVKELEDTLEERNKHMIQRLGDSAASAVVAICGLAHCQDILRHANAPDSRYHTAALRLCKSQKLDFTGMPKAAAATDFAMDPKNMREVTLDKGPDINLHRLPYPDTLRLHEKLLECIDHARQKNGASRGI